MSDNPTRQLEIIARIEAYVRASADRIEVLENAIRQALACTPSIRAGIDGRDLPQATIQYDCGDPWETLRTALNPEVPYP